MDIKQISGRMKGALSKYKYVAIVLLVGIGLMLIPSFDRETKEELTQTIEESGVSIEETLSHLLSKMQGAGKVEVMLNVGRGEEIIYQTDEDVSESESGLSDRSQTVTLTDGQRNQFGLVQQINPPTYLGAIILCQGANDPVVKLSIVEAVSKVTGLNASQICVLKMV